MPSRDPSVAPSPVLRRLRAALVDPRLLIGVFLIAGSTAGVVALVSAADETVDVYVATGPLNPGDTVDEGDLEIRGVGLSAASEWYLVPGEIPDSGVIVTRPVSAGELVPDSAVGSSRSSRLASIVVSTPGALPAAVGAGSTVDLWAARRGESGQFETPTVIVGDAIVVRLVSTETIVSGGDVTAVEVLVPKSTVARVLDALANDAEISIVPTSLPVGH